MASTEVDRCTNFPDFAVICSFIDKFGERLGANLPNIGELQTALENTEEVSPVIVQLVHLLLRKINRAVKIDRWERALQRFAHLQSHKDGWELERFGFKQAQLEVKIRVLKNLFEALFDSCKSFKDKVNALAVRELRLMPCGRDKRGVMYWCQLDDCANLRIYKDDQDDETWTLAASSREELVALLNDLESMSPGGGISRELSVEGSTSNSPLEGLSEAATPVASGRTSPVALVAVSVVTDAASFPGVDSKQPVTVAALQPVPTAESELTAVNIVVSKSDSLTVADPANVTVKSTVLETSISVPAVSSLEIDTESEAMKAEGVATRTEDTSMKTEDTSTKLKDKCNIVTAATEIVSEATKVQEKETKTECTSKTEGTSIKTDHEAMEEEGASAKTSDARTKSAPFVEEEAIKQNSGLICSVPNTITLPMVDTGQQDIGEKTKKKGAVNTALGDCTDKPIKNVDALSDPQNKLLCPVVPNNVGTGTESKIEDRIMLENENVLSQKESHSYKVKQMENTEEVVISSSPGQKPDLIKADINKSQQVNKEASECDQNKEKPSAIASNHQHLLATQPKSHPERILNLKSHSIGEIGEEHIPSPKPTNKSVNSFKSHPPKSAKGISERQLVSVAVSKKADVSVPPKHKELEPTCKVSNEVKGSTSGTTLNKNIAGDALIETNEMALQTAIKTSDVYDKRSKAASSPTDAELPKLTGALKELGVGKHSGAIPVVADTDVKLPECMQSGEAEAVGKRELGVKPLVEITDSLSRSVEKSLHYETKKIELCAKLESKTSSVESTIHEGTGNSGVTRISSEKIATSKYSDGTKVVTGIPSDVSNNAEPPVVKKLKISKSSSNEVPSNAKWSDDQECAAGDKSAAVVASPTRVVTVNDGSSISEPSDDKGSVSNDATEYVAVPSSVDLCNVELSSNDEKIVGDSSNITVGSKTVPVTIQSKPTGTKSGDASTFNTKTTHSDSKFTTSQSTDASYTTDMDKKLIPPTTSTTSRSTPILLDKTMEKHSTIRKSESNEKISSLKLTPAESVFAKESELLENSLVKKPILVKPVSAHETEVTEKRSMQKPTLIKPAPVKELEAIEKISVQKPSLVKPVLAEKSEVSEKSSVQKITLCEPVTVEEAKLTEKGSVMIQQSISKNPVPAKLSTTVVSCSEQKTSGKFEPTKESAESVKGGSKPKTLVSPESTKEFVSKAMSSVEKSLTVKELPKESEPSEKSSLLKRVAAKFAMSNKAEPNRTATEKCSSVVSATTQVTKSSTDHEISFSPTASKTLVGSEGTKRTPSVVKVTDDGKSSENCPSLLRPKLSKPIFTQLSNELSDDKKSAESKINPDHKLSDSKTAAISSTDVTQITSVKPVSDENPELPKKIGDRTIVLNKSCNINRSTPSLSSSSEAVKKDTSNSVNVPGASKEPLAVIENKAEKPKEAETHQISVNLTATKSEPKKVPNEEKIPVTVSDKLSASIKSKLRETDEVTEPSSKKIKLDDSVSDMSKVSDSTTNNVDTKLPDICDTVGDEIPNEIGSGSKSDAMEAITEPVMIIKGDGDGAKCKAGNPFLNLSEEKTSRYCESVELKTVHNSLSSSSLHQSQVRKCLCHKPWWECFDCVPPHHLKENSKITPFLNNEVIVEPVMMVLGDGAGAASLAGNSDDEEGQIATEKEGGKAVQQDVTKRGKKIAANGGDSKAAPATKKGVHEAELDGAVLENEASDDEHAEKNNTCAAVEEKNRESNSIPERRRNLRNSSRAQSDSKVNGLKNVSKTKTDVVCSKSESSKTGSENSSLQQDDQENNEVEESIPEEKIEKDPTNSITADETNEHNASTGEPPMQGVENGDSEATTADVSAPGEEEEPLAPAEDVPQTPVKRRGRPKKRGGNAGGRPVGRPKSADDSRADDSEASSPPRKRVKPDLTDNDTQDAIDEAEQGMRRQRSARIAKIQEKELLDRKKLEEMRLQELAEEKRLREMFKKEREERRTHREKKKDKKERRQEKEKDKGKEKVKKKRKKKRKHKRNPNDPWAASSSSSEEEEEEEDDEEFSEEEEELVFKSDHEFSPESDMEEGEAVPVKRARTAREEKLTLKLQKKQDLGCKEGKDEESKAVIDAPAAVEDEQEDADVKEEDDTKCEKCSHEDHPETILLCDLCDHGWHLSCLRPPLLAVPEGEWVCPDCQHVALILRLKQLLNKFDATQKRAETMELQKQRLEFVNVSLKNVIKKKKRRDHSGDEDGESGSDDSSSGSGSSSSDSDSSSSSSSDSDSSGPLYTLRARRSQPLKQKFENYDELIDDAIRSEMEAAAGAGNAGRGKDIENILQAEKDEEEEEEDESMDTDLPKGDTEKEEDEGKSVKQNAKTEEKDEAMEVDGGESSKTDPPTQKEVKKVEFADDVDIKVKVEEEGGAETKTDAKPSENFDAKTDAEENNDVTDGTKLEEKENGDADEDDEDIVAPKRKKKKAVVKDSDDEEEDESQSGGEEEDDDDDEPPSPPRRGRKGGRSLSMAATKKKRRLTDLDVDEEDDDDDEDFMGSSMDDEDSDLSAASSSSMATESETEDSDVVGPRSRIMPLRRSARNRRNLSDDEDSNKGHRSKKKKNKKKAKKKSRNYSSSEEDESSDDSEYGKKKTKRKRSVVRSKSRSKSRSKRKGGSKKKGAKKSTARSKSKSADGEDAPKPKPRPKVRYSAPPADDEEEDPGSKRRVTRGRQVHYFDHLMLTEDEEEEEQDEKPRRGKVMKGERVETESSDYQDSADERMKRRGVRGGLGRGKVMPDEEDDECESKIDKKKRGRPKKAEDEGMRDKPIQASKPKASPEKAASTPTMTETSSPISSAPVSAASTVSIPNTTTTSKTANAKPSNSNPDKLGVSTVTSPAAAPTTPNLPTSTAQLPASPAATIMASSPAAPPPETSNSAALVAAAMEAVSKTAEMLSGSVTIKPLPSSLSVHPIIRSSGPNVVRPPTMSLTAIAAAAKPTASGLQQGLSHSQRWPPHLNTLSALAEISGQRLGAPLPSSQNLTSAAPPPPYMTNMRQPSLPSSLSVIRKQGPFQSHAQAAAAHMLGGHGSMPPLSGPQFGVGSGHPARHSAPHQQKTPSKSSPSKGNPSAAKTSNTSTNPLLGSPGLANTTITLLQSASSTSGHSSPDSSKPNSNTRPSVPSPTPSTLPHSVSQSALTVSTAASNTKPPHPGNLIPSSLGSPYAHFAEHYPGHPTFGGYPPRLHGPPSRHPPPLHAAPGAPIPPNMYGSPMAHPGYHPSQPPHHPGVLRGPHDMYRPSPPHPGHSSPNHPASHSHLLMKGYPGMETLGGYPGSPGSTQHSPHQSPVPGSPGGDDGERGRSAPAHRKAEPTEPGEFSSGLLSYFSSQREDDMD